MLSPDFRGSARPTVVSRVLAVVVLMVVGAGGAYLAHALTAGWRESLTTFAERGARGLTSVDPAEPPPSEAATREAADAMLAAIRERGRDTAEGRPAVDARAWGDRMAGGQTTAEPLGLPPGARRLLRMAGGFTFYRLREGHPAERMAEAVTYYRAALAEGGWHILVDHAARTSAAVPSRPAENGTAGDVPAGQDRPGQTEAPPERAGHLILAERGAERVSIFVRRRLGAAHAVVRVMQG